MRIEMQQHTTITEATFIGDADLRPIRKRRGRPTHRILVSFSAAYFAGALVTDIAYWQMPDVMGERVSIWLIAAGLIMARLGPTPFRIAIARHARSAPPALAPVLRAALAFMLPLTDDFRHTPACY